MDFRSFKNILNKPVSFEISQVSDRIFILNFESKNQMSLTMLRFNEHFECKQFKGKTFSHDKYFDWYKKEQGRMNKRKSFDYNEIIQGYLIPSKALKPFYNYKFKDLSYGEQQILKIFSKIKHKKFSIIAMHNEYEPRELLDRRNTYYHELAHAFYSLYPRYKRKVDKVIDSIDNTEMEKFLAEKMYRKRCFNDESNSYLLHDQSDLREAGIDLKYYKDTIKKLKKLFIEQKNKVNLRRYSRKRKYSDNSYKNFF